MMGVVVKNRCALCGKPVYSEQGYHTITQNHFDCEKKLDEQVETFSKELDAYKKPRARSGTGALAQKVKSMVISALERETGETIVLSTVNLWLQNGAYRGQHWDLDSWGVDAEATGRNTFCCSSLAPMSHYKKCHQVSLQHDVMNCYHISPVNIDQKELL